MNSRYKIGEFVEVKVYGKWIPAIIAKNHRMVHAALGEYNGKSVFYPFPNSTYITSQSVRKLSEVTILHKLYIQPRLRKMLRKHKMENYKRSSVKMYENEYEFTHLWAEEKGLLNEILKAPSEKTLVTTLTEH